MTRQVFFQLFKESVGSFIDTLKAFWLPFTSPWAYLRSLHQLIGTRQNDPGTAAKTAVLCEDL